MNVHNAGNFLPIDSVNPWRPESSATPLWGYKISHFNIFENIYSNKVTYNVLPAFVGLWSTARDVTGYIWSAYPWSSGTGPCAAVSCSVSLHRWSRTAAEHRNTQHYRTTAEHRNTQHYRTTAEHGNTQHYRTTAEHGNTQHYRTTAEHGNTQHYRTTAEHGNTQHYRTTAEHGNTQHYRTTAEHRNNCRTREYTTL